MGGHILSGAVIDPRALTELFPDSKKNRGAPLLIPATEDQFLLLTNYRWRLRLPIAVGIISL